MHRTLSTCVLLCLTVCATANEPAAKTDYQKWEGVWKSQRNKAGKTLEIKNREVKMPAPGGELVKFRLRLNTSAKPRQFDFVLDKPGDTFDGKALILGIYEFVSDDEIEISLSAFPLDRPRNFSSGTSDVLLRSKD